MRRPWIGLLLIVVSTFALFARAEESESAESARDALVFKDGDRVHGQLLEKTPDMIVFKSDRFGVLRVPAADAVVINAEKPVAKAPEPPAKSVVAAGIQPEIAAEKAAVKEAQDRAEAERVSIWERFSPAVLTAKVRNFFGPWHGRLAFSNEVVTDTAHRNNLALDGRLQRKWSKDEVEMTARYDFDQVDGVTATDMIKGTGSWRHDFNRKQFAQYRPTVEWSRAGRRRGLTDEYVLVQQEIGVGVNVWSTPSRKVRLGISENLFDLWSSEPGADHGSRAVESLFDETELTFPWRMRLSQRAVWYPEPHDVDGWENRIELNKKLTETLSVALRHEIRRHNPDGTALDYTRLKLLFGLDF